MKDRDTKPRCDRLVDVNLWFPGPGWGSFAQVDLTTCRALVGHDGPCTVAVKAEEVQHVLDLMRT